MIRVIFVCDSCGAKGEGKVEPPLPPRDRTQRPYTAWPRFAVHLIARDAQDEVVPDIDTRTAVLRVAPPSRWLAEECPACVALRQGGKP